MFMYMKSVVHEHLTFCVLTKYSMNLKLCVFRIKTDVCVRADPLAFLYISVIELCSTSF
jgi:hypothetical protein